MSTTIGIVIAALAGGAVLAAALFGRSGDASDTASDSADGGDAAAGDAGDSSGGDSGGGDSGGSSDGGGGSD